MIIITIYFIERLYIDISTILYIYNIYRVIYTYKVLSNYNIL
jgi:hypothetical protein